MSIEWDAAGASDVGLVRRGNEDAFLVDRSRGVFLVADGMGGHAAGEIASALATETVGRELAEAVDAEWRVEDWGERFGTAFSDAWREIVRCCREDPETDGMGTTLTAAVVLPDGSFRIGHIGDSRAYRIHDHAIERLTHDHTWVQREVDAGRLAEAAADTHPFAHILTRVLSADLPPHPDLLSGRIDPGDALLLTSDGLHGLLSDEEILALASSAERPADLVDALIRLANQRGGRDNITAVAVKILPGEPGADGSVRRGA